MGFIALYAKVIAAKTVNAMRNAGGYEATKSTTARLVRAKRPASSFVIEPSPRLAARAPAWAAFNLARPAPSRASHVVELGCARRARSNPPDVVTCAMTRAGRRGVLRKERRRGRRHGA